MLSFEEIMQIAQDGSNVILTLHDQRFFTGGCHYSLECQGFMQKCSMCPRVPRILQRRVEGNLISLKKFSSQIGDNFRIITPSKWLADEAKKSSLLFGRSIEYIPN
jgi:ribosomal protein S27AE